MQLIYFKKTSDFWDISVFVFHRFFIFFHFAEGKVAC